MPPVTKPRIVVVGGGFAGLYAVKGLRRAAADVLLIDRCNHHTFQPLLYQVATAALRWWRRMCRNGAAIDLSRRQLSVDEVLYRYDYLVLAAGAAHAYFGHDDWKRHAPGLKTLEDALL